MPRCACVNGGWRPVSSERASRAQSTKPRNGAKLPSKAPASACLRVQARIVQHGYLATAHSAEPCSPRPLFTAALRHAVARCPDGTETAGLHCKKTLKLVITHHTYAIKPRVVDTGRSVVRRPSFGRCTGQIATAALPLQNTCLLRVGHVVPRADSPNLLE